MLTDERIKEAQNNVKSYFNEGLLKKVGYRKNSIEYLNEILKKV